MEASVSGRLSSLLVKDAKLSPFVQTDIDDFLTEEIKGPASFSCQTGADCKFEEPAMNQLINDVFGDGYISISCEGGECLHYSQVPGYVVSTLFLLETVHTQIN